MYPNPPVSPFIKFQMTKVSDYPNEDPDHALDNLEELQQQGWIPGQSCLIEVDELGNLGPCLPLPTFNLNQLLLGLGIICLLICWAIYFIKRIYRRKFQSQSLFHITYFIPIYIHPLSFISTLPPSRSRSS